MTVTLRLSTDSINQAIRQLTNARDDFNYAVHDLVESLAYDGAEVAEAAYGGMVHAAAMPSEMTEAKIVVPGGDRAIIAEFGAGYATMEYHPFAKNAPVPIKVASYSYAQYPIGLFAVTNDLYPGEGYWIFGRTKAVKGFTDPIYYDRVEPRHGLLNAYDYINEHYLRVWKEVSKI